MSEGNYQGESFATVLRDASPELAAAAENVAALMVYVDAMFGPDVTRLSSIRDTFDEWLDDALEAQQAPREVA